MIQDIHVSVSGAAPEEVAGDALVLFVPEKGTEPFRDFRKVDQKLKKALSSVIKDERFQGKPGDALVYHTSGLIRAARVIVSGLGKKEKWNAEVFRRAAASAAVAARNAACSRVVFSLPTETGVSIQAAAGAVVDGALLGSYRYVKFKTKEEEIESEKNIESITLLADSPSAVHPAIAKSKLYAEATCFARDLVNEPANELNPEVLADRARKAAREAGLGFRVLEAPELQKLHAGAILGVGSGSRVPPRLIQLTYQSGNKKGRKVALVGKGITFDSGGLSLKTSKYMETMKCDMAGAAAVLAAMRALPQIKPDFDVTGILCAAENMPSGSAIRPGDVLTTMNGKTIEVINTDAEGRLVLADGLSWAVKQGAREIIDLATLTGACVIGLGPYIAGVLSNNKELAQSIIAAGDQVGEQFWELPVSDDYDFMIKSDIADMKNLAQNSEAGATQGALLLREFIGDAKWAHLDIAGPAWYDKDFFYNRKNGSGFGVRTLLQYLSKQ
jgi:leucyl aminopeptidase